MNKSIAERLAAGEKIPVSDEELKLLDEVIPHLTLQYRLQELKREGKVSTVPGSFPDSTRWTYEDRPLYIVHAFKGQPSWDNGPENGFDKPHDLAVDLETNTIIAFARS